MNIKHLLLFALFLHGLNGLNTLSADCLLSELELQKSTCNGEKFAVKINFKFQDVSNCFTISGNGKNYGTFEYSKLPVIIDGLVGDCHTEYEFVITDCVNTHCFTSQNLGVVCCPSSDCKISALKLEKTDCDSNNLFFVKLSFDHENTSTCFKLKINNDTYGVFDYSALPIKIGPLKGDCATARVFSVYDCVKPDVCNARIEMEKVCCTNECKISNIKIEKTDCDSNNMFIAVISFKAENVSDSFLIKVNDKIYGKFKYGISAYKVGPLLGDCVTKFKFLIFDHKDAHCAEDTLWGPVCCGNTPDPCKLSGLNVVKTACDDHDQFSLIINFDHSNTSDCFHLFINNDLYNTFPYSSLPLKVGPFPGDCHTEYRLLIKDCKDPHCTLEKFIGVVCCPPPGDCKLSALDITKEDCNSDNQFFVKINLQNINSSECFNVFVAGHTYGPFKYLDLPIRLGPFDGDCKTDYAFLIKDCVNPDCRIDKSIGKVCCTSTGNCKIEGLRLDPDPCNPEGNFFVNLNFNHENTSHCFKLKINNETFGVFEYSTLPVKIGPLKGDCVTSRVFAVYDCERPDACFAKIEMDKVCCDSLPPCHLSNLNVHRTDCDANNEFFVSIDFKASNTSGCFRIKGNGNNYGEFSYANLPVKLGPFKGDCKTNYEFLIQDCKNERCALENNLGIVCCGGGDCKLSELQLEKTECFGDKQFYVYLKFNFTGVSQCFRVRGNGHDYGEYKYGQLPIKLGPFIGDCNTNYEFAVEDCVKTDCHIGKELGKVCCDGSNAKIYEVVMARTDCEPDSTFKVKFNFHYRDVSDSFNIFVNGRMHGTFGYNQLPVSTGPLLADCKTIYKIHLIDQKDSTIRIERFIERPCCHPNIEECKIYEVKANPLHCTGPGEYALMLNFRHRGTTNQHFDVYDRIGPIGYFLFSPTSYDTIIINNFKASGRDYDFVKICENDNPRCCTSVEFRTIECDSFANNPDKFRVTDLIVNINSSSNRVSLFSKIELPGDLEIEMFNLEGRQLPIDIVERQPHEIFISSNHLMTDLYFIRIKSLDAVKTYKFFHIR